MGEVLNVRSCVAVGWSGGGPYALAGVGPLDKDLDFFDGMGEDNVQELTAALAGEEALRTWLTENGEGYRGVTGKDLADTLGGLVPPVDRDLLVGGFADTLADSTRR